MLDHVGNGFAALAVQREVTDAALANVEKWLLARRFASYRPQLEKLIAAERWTLLLDSFYRTIPFGTGGRRGPVGIGTNRINSHTVATAVQGHVDYLRATSAGARLRVVVAFDCRVFNDLRGVYDRALPNPLLGVRSRDFARLAAGVYAANGIQVITVPGDDFLMATPELSFAIRYAGAAGGLNISASHNHPDDNGTKFYTEYGGQPIAPYDEQMAAAVDAVTEVEHMPFGDAVRCGRVEWWDEAAHEAYLNASLERSLDPTARGASIIYSPLHGAGRHTVGDVLRRAGFPVAVVESQAEPNGEFPNVKYRIPNPEVPEAMEAATEMMMARGADAAMASDPDADRIGLVVRHAGGARFLTGNEIGALLAAYVIERRRQDGGMPPRPFVVKTAVTTELIGQIARRNGVAVIGDLLVGFKYVAAVLEGIARDGRYGKVEASPEDFLLATEESNGVLVSAAIRDKDAAGAALLLAELIADRKRRGQTAVDYLEEIHRRYGSYANTGYSLVMEGVIGLQRIEAAMAALRRNPPREFMGSDVTGVVDYWDERAFGPLCSDTDRAARNVIMLFVEPGLKIAARPSGTEPKLKVYVEGWGDSQDVIERRVGEAKLVFVEHLLQYLGISIARPGLLLSPLVSVENRIDFAARFLPDLRQQLDSCPDEVELRAWVDSRVRAYGKDARFLVAPGIAAIRGEAGFREHGLLLQRVFELDR